MKCNDTRLAEALKKGEISAQVMGSIAGKYIYLEIPFEGELVCEQLEKESGEVMYFKSEDEAYKFLESVTK